LHTALQRFYALGYDAFLVHRELANLQRAEGKQPLFAATGLLSLESGRIKRRTGWAKFNRGRVVSIDAIE
jgi:outer membrane PBP1 activator LpoA protein